MYKKSRIIAFAIFVVLCSLFTGKLTDAQAQQQYIKASLKNDFPIVINGTKEGTLLQNNSFLFTTENQTDYYIQWRDQTIEVPADLISIQQGADVSGALTAQTPVNFIVSSGSVSINDANNNVIGSLEPNIKYPILAGTSSTYKILIGNSSAFVNKSGSIQTGAYPVQSPGTTTNTASSSTAGTVQTASSNTVTAMSAATTTSSAVKSTVTQSTTRSFTASDKYFKVTVNNLGVYVNSNGSLVKVGELTNGQSYPRVADYGNWHQIKWGNGNAFVWKGSTQPIDSPKIANLNNGQKNSSLSVYGPSDLTVYDNSSGKLVAFGKIMANKLYPVIGDFGNWYTIDISGRIGYIYKPNTTRPFQAADHYFTALKDHLTVYDNSSGKLVAVGSLVKGQSYPRIKAYGSSWHQIRFGNGYGYVYAADTQPASGSDIKNIDKTSSKAIDTFIPLADLPVYDNSSGHLVQFALLNSNKQYPVIGVNGNWYMVDVSGRTGYVYKPNTRKPFKTTDRFFKVLLSDVKIYSNDTGSLTEVGRLVNGQVYQRISDYGNWHQIQLGNHYGYVWEASTTPDDGKTLKNIYTSANYGSNTFYTNTDTAVYDNSSGKLVPFATLESGNAFNYISSNGSNWITVDVSGRMGYVYKGNVSLGLTVTAPALKVYSTYSQLSDSTQQGASNTSLKYGDQVIILSTNNYGAQIRTLNGSVTGWVQKDYLDSFPANNWWFVKQGRNLRASYTSQSASLGYISDGTAVHVLDYNIGNDPSASGWYKVQTTDGKIGWIWGNSVDGSNINQYEKDKVGASTNAITIFTPLNTQASITADQINKFINYATNGNTSSSLYNMGSAFIEAQKETGVNAVYLLAHAALETGYGTSNIVNSKYNYYGIGAFDACPYSCASTYSGQTAGIIEGAKWIASNYINNTTYEQFTLDSMRYNSNTHQYASDEAWSEKIALIAQKFLNYINSISGS